MEQHAQASREGSTVAASRAPRPLRRWEASAYLKNKFGISLALTTLAKLACLGGGPPFFRNARAPLYPVDALEQWAIARQGPLYANTSGGRA